MAQYLMSPVTTASTTNVIPNVLWSRWNLYPTITSSTSVVDSFWGNFQNGTTAAITQVWGNWQGPYDDPIYTPTHQRFIPPTEAEKAQQVAARARRAEIYAEDQRKRARADKRALDLLKSVLTEEQRRDLRDHEHFFVKGSAGGLYRIDKGTHGNVKRVDPISKVWMEQLCIQPSGVPDGDSMLAQKLLIESHEETFRAHANITLRDGGLIRGLTAKLDSKVLEFRKAA